MIHFTTKLKNIFLLTTCILATWLAAPQTRAQGTTAFTHQGQFHDNGTTATTLGNGLVSVNLDFGAVAFNGGARRLGITVSNGVAQTLAPRVQALPAPYAQFAVVTATVTNSAIMNAHVGQRECARVVEDDDLFILHFSGKRVSPRMNLVP